jgi:hypothetical protein
MVEIKKYIDFRVRILIRYPKFGYPWAMLKTRFLGLTVFSRVFLGGYPRKLKRAIFQTFWKGDCCPKSLFLS